MPNHARNAHAQDRPATRPELPPPTSSRSARGWPPSATAPILAGAVLAVGVASYLLVLNSDGPIIGSLPQTMAMVVARSDTASAPRMSREDEISHYLVRSTLMALDDAHRTGNYAVLRDLAAPAFQAANPTGRLAEAFSAQRREGLDLSVAALSLPLWSTPPAVGRDGRLRLSGSYGHGGERLRFSLGFAPVAGIWRLDELHVGREPDGQDGMKSAALRRSHD